MAKSGGLSKRRKASVSNFPFPEGPKTQPKWVGGSDWTGTSVKDPKPIFYLSGTLSGKGQTEEKFFAATGYKYRCISFAYCSATAPFFDRRHYHALNFCLSNGHRIFLDSGAHSFHTLIYRKGVVRGKSQVDRLGSVEEQAKQFMSLYADYVRATRGLFDFYVTFDWRRHCPTIWKATAELQDMGIRPVPVYHGDHSLTWFEKYADAGHKIMGLGLNQIGKNSRKDVRFYYDQVFTCANRYNIKLHGFAVTGPIAFDYPFWSVDSTTWIKAAAYGKIVTTAPSRRRISLVHISTTEAKSSGYGTVDGLNKDTYKFLRDLVEKDGFDFEELRRSIPARAIYNAITFKRISESGQPCRWAPLERLI